LEIFTEIIILPKLIKDNYMEKNFKVRRGSDSGKLTEIIPKCLFNPIAMIRD
jgi:hypothetical protein